MKNTPEVKPHTFTHNGDEVLILRRVSKDRKAYGNFIYPKGVDQVVTAQDFSSKQQCGGGLHGWPWDFGIGDGSNYDILEDTWLILGAKPEDIVGEIEGGYKCKVRTAVIRYDGEFTGAMAMLRDGFHACIKAMATPEPVIIAAGAASSVLVVSSTEKNAKSSQSGDNAKSSQSGKNCAAAIAANQGHVKTGPNGAFALAFFISDEEGWDFVTGKVGRDGIKADTWYGVKDGKLVEEAP